MTFDGTTVQIGLLTYEIKEVADLTAEGGRSLYGQCDFGNGVIKLDSGMRPDPKAIVLLHEITHAIFENAGQPHNEGTIDAIAYGFLQLLRQNPRLVLQLIKPQAAQ